MKTNLYNKPFSYRELGQKKPVKEGRAAPSPLLVRVYVCKDCHRPGGTLRNIGTHREPVYVHPACQKQADQRAAGGNHA